MSFQFVSHLKNNIQQTYQDDSLLACLEKISKIIKSPIQWESISHLNLLTIDNLSSHEETLKFMMLPVTLESHDPLMHSLYPILVEYEISNQFRVLTKNLLGKSQLYNPCIDQYEPLPQDFYETKILRAWQCCPIHFPLSSRLKDLFKSIFSSFKSELFQIIGVGMLASSMTLLIAMISGYIFSHLHQVHSAGYFIVLISFFIFTIGSVILSAVNDLYVKTMNAKLLFSMLPSVWYRMLSLPLKTSKKMISGEWIQKIADYEMSIASLGTSSLTILFDGMVCFFLLAYMAWHHIFLAGIYLIICLVVLGLKFSILPQTIQLIALQLTQKATLSAWLNETLLQIHKCRSAGSEETIYRKCLQTLFEQKEYEEKSIKLDIFSKSLDIVLPLFLYLSFYGMVYFEAKLSPTILLPFMVCAGQFMTAFEKFSASILLISHLLPGLKKMEVLLNEPVEMYENKNTHFEPQGNLSLMNVCWKDEETGRLILNHISMEIKAGQFVGLIGPSGAGKTSIFKLLLGFETLTSGSILMDGIHLKHLNMQAIRKQFGIVLQTTHLFPGSIFSNIASNTNLSLEEAWELARCVGLDEEIKAMPMHMHTHLSDNPGESISGGQRQKILIARALALKPKILLLDEATSALDNESQRIIHQNLKSMNITRLVIAHRYSTLQDADLIYKIHQGEIVHKEFYEVA